ncbi:MAG: LysE family translocator [Pseudomonadota bacterium]
MQSLLPLAMFAFVLSITPGPNNIMLTSSGIVFGFVRSIPHILGISVGGGILLVLCAAGIGSLILALPSAHLMLKVIGSSYLVYLAWQLRRMTFKQAAVEQGTPMPFWGAVLFQFVNPKVWMMGITGAAAFLPAMQPVWLAIGIFTLVFCAVNLPCISLWACIGATLRRYLTQALWQNLFKTLMILATLYSALAVWL